jgi:beta-N-acetylhexosaminidase
MMVISTNSLTTEQKIGQLFFTGIAGPELDDATKELLDRIQPGGVCLFARNIKSPEQTRELLDSIVEFLDVPPFLSVDQEGGLVDRLRRIMSPAPAAAKFRSVDDVREFAEITAESLRLIGFNMDFAPVVDVITPEREEAGNGMYSRGFGHNQADVIDLAGNFLETLQANGIIGSLKHFPGLGAARVDSHEELPRIEIPDDELANIDLLPYKELLEDAAMVMVAHAAYPTSRYQGMDNAGKPLPSSLSTHFVSDLLRSEIGFDGVVVTDDLEMGAIVRNYGVGDACKMATSAGNDMLAICAGREAIIEGHAAITKAVETGDFGFKQLDGSVERILALKQRISPQVDFDASRLSELTLQLKDLSSRLD